MLGYIEMREAAIWVQTNEPSTVYATCRSSKSTGGAMISTDTLKTQTRNANTATLVFRFLDPGTSYQYQLFINNKEVELPYSEFKTQTDWAYKQDPPAFSVATGSCVYINEDNSDRPGKAYGGDYKIFEHMADHQPDIMLWLGDNIYLRPSDWGSRSGYLHRYSHTRAIPEMQKLLQVSHNYAIWDDHEYGPNNGIGSWRNKDIALESFECFWANPSYGTNELPGAHTAFNYADVDFFLLDNRSYRTDLEKAETEQILGKDQIDLLISRLKFSSASFKIIAIGGQLVSDAAVFENHANYELEREYILDRIKEEKIKNVVILSGDRHASEVSYLKLDEEIEIWEFTVSPLTSGSANNEDEANSYRVKDSYIAKRNYGLIKFSGSYEQRVLQFEFYDSEGKRLKSYTIPKM